MRNTIYKAIADRAAAARLGIAHVSLWNRNTDRLRESKAFRMPALFVEFAPIAWSQLSRGGRTAEVRVKIHVVTETLATPEMGGRYQDKALEHLDFLERVGAAMQGLSGDGFNHFVLIETATDHDHEQIRCDELTFITRAVDLSSVRACLKFPPK